MTVVEQIRLLEPMIIPSCGAKDSGDIVTPEDCGESWEWIINNARFEVVETDVPVVEQEVSEPESVDPDPVVEPEVDATEEPEAVVDEVVETPVEEVAVTEVTEETVVPTETVVTDEEAQALEAIKAVLSGGKGRLADIVEKSGLTEEVVSALLTEANGFFKNQQGWYGTAKS